MKGTHGYFLLDEYSTEWNVRVSSSPVKEGRRVIRSGFYKILVWQEYDLFVLSEIRQKIISILI